jgi:NADH pyrophosphatase NudC (nudix superfamily)
MSLTDFISNNAALILSIVCAATAAVILLHETLKAATGNAIPNQPTTRDLVSTQGILRAAALLNGNLAQCPTCSMIDHAYTRYCTRCGTPMQTQNIQARYLGEYGATQMFGILTTPNPDTRIGILIGVQNTQPERRQPP